jgi:ribosomal protein S30
MDTDLGTRAADGNASQGTAEPKIREGNANGPAKAVSNSKPRVRNRKKDSAADEEANKRRCVSTACIGTLSARQPS